MEDLTPEQLEQIHALTDTQRDLLVQIQHHGYDNGYRPDRHFGNCLSPKTAPFVGRSFTGRQHRPALWLTPLGQRAAEYIWQNRKTMLKQWKPTNASGPSVP